MASMAGAKIGGRHSCSRLPAALAAALGLALWAGAPSARAQDAAQSYTLPSQPLGAALNQLALTADRQIMVPPALVRGRNAPALSGRYTLDEALTRLLAGSGLSYRIGGNGVITIVTGPGPQARPPVPASGRDDPPEEAPIQLNAVEVTGSRLKRVDVEGPSQVISISREDIARSGSATVRDVLNALPQNAVALDESGANTFAGMSTVQLRGLSTGSTLVLINGRRVSANNARYFDLNSIPIDVIERIEVLTDTASAIYGADAIGGAVNFILRREYQGAGLSVRYGTSSRHDASEKGGSLAFGGSGDTHSGLIMFSVFERDPLMANARELTRTLDFRRFGGRDMRGTNTYPANVYALPGAGNLPGLEHGFAGVPAGTDGTGLTPADFAATDGVLNLYDGAAARTLITQSRRSSAFAQGTVQLSPATKIYGEMLISRNHQISTLGPESLSGGPNAIFVVSANNPFNPFGVPVGIDYQLHELGPRTNDTTTDYTRFLAGVSGQLADRFDWDLNLMSDRNQMTIDYRNFVDWYLPGRRELVQRYLDSTDPSVALNVFSSTGNNNPATLDALRNDRTETNVSKANSVEASVRGPVLTLPAGDIQVVVGGTAVRADGSYSTGVKARTESHALFLESAIPLAAPAQRLAAAYSAEVNLAVRRDHFSTFGDQTSPQVGLSWRPVRTLLVRGSFGKAFKAPSVNDLYSPRMTAVSAGIPDPLRDGEVSNFLLVQGGNPLLAPEKAEAMTFGIIWEPAAVSGLSLGVTAFRIKHEDFISRFSDYQTMLRRPDVFGDRIVRADPTPEDIAAGRPGRLLSLDSSAVNYGGVEVRGADVDVRFVLPETAWGQFSWSLLGSYIDEYLVQLTPAAPPSNQVGRANRAGYPTHFKGNFQTAWTGFNGLGAALTARHTGSYADYTDYTNAPPRIPSQTLWDLQVSYSHPGDGPAFLRGFRAELGVINLGDRQGSFSNTFAGYDFQQADMRGRFFYLSLHKSF